MHNRTQFSTDFGSLVVNPSEPMHALSSPAEGKPPPIRAPRLLHALKELAKVTPLLRPVLKRRYDSQFAENLVGQLYRGIFHSYEAARASSPRELVGYDQAAPAAMYRDFMHRIESYDYPVLFWLQRVLSEPTSAPHRVFDFGGHVGIKYYAYQPLLRQVPDWLVCDVAAVVQRGRELAQDRAETRLGFTVDFDRAMECSVLLCLGSLQYVEAPLSDLLGALSFEQRPPHVLINTTAFTAQDEPQYYTLNSIGTAFCPYKVQDRAAFVTSMRRVGYVLLSEWENPARACHIPFQDAHRDFSYRGMRFSKSQS